MFATFQSWRSTDIDLFLTVRRPSEARSRIRKLLRAIVHALPAGVSIRVSPSRHALTLILPPPYRKIQIILRLYHSPEQVLLGFDLDVSSVLFDGKSVLASQRCVRALIRREILVDPTRQSTTLEDRLRKYASRGFRVAMPPMSFSSEVAKVRRALLKWPRGDPRICSDLSGASLFLLKFAAHVLTQPPVRWRVANAMARVYQNAHRERSDYAFHTRAERRALARQATSLTETRLEEVVHEVNFFEGDAHEQGRPESSAVLWTGSFHPTTYQWYASPLATD